jgi:hypothetical protein
MAADTVKIENQLKSCSPLDDISINYLARLIISEYTEFKERVKWIDPLSIIYFTDPKKIAERDKRKRRKALANIISIDDVKRYDLIFIPIHSNTVALAFDSDDEESTSPSVIEAKRSSYDNTNFGHWSLLVYFTKNNMIYHYDSLGDKNSLFVRKLVWLLYKKTTGFINLDTDVYEVDYLPIQDSYWQCGYVLLMIIKLTLEKRRSKKLSTFQQLSRTEIACAGSFTSEKICKKFASDLIENNNVYNVL